MDRIGLLLLLPLIVLSIFLGYSFGFPRDANDNPEVKVVPKKEILRVALVADSHNENELLGKALSEAKNRDVNFVIGLGDYTNLGTTSELADAKRVFDESGLVYFLTAGDRDGWDSRRRRQDVDNFADIFGDSSWLFERSGIQFVILDNSNIYKGIDNDGWNLLNTLPAKRKLTFVFAHKTPFHPDSKHVMGEDSPEVAKQANRLIEFIESKKVDGFFSGDLHFFAQFKSPQQSVKITTVGAVASERNFQGPRFSILKVFDDDSWEVEDVEIK